jgi:succinyl-CoA synthetase beta subunit
MKLYNVFLGVDASLAEINPLVLDGNGMLVALDAKINLDDNGCSAIPNSRRCAI